MKIYQYGFRIEVGDWFYLVRVHQPSGDRERAQSRAWQAIGQPPIAGRVQLSNSEPKGWKFTAETATVERDQLGDIEWVKEPRGSLATLDPETSL